MICIQVIFIKIKYMSDKKQVMRIHAVIKNVSQKQGCLLKSCDRWKCAQIIYHRCGCNR